MEEKNGLVTLHGNPVTLLGPTLSVGDAAPNATALANDLRPVELAAYHGKIVILSFVPSLDTPVCDMETRRFNELAAHFSDNIAILTVSVDLPFAQARWCGHAEVEQVVTLSDHRDLDFGQKFGVLIKDLRLLARAVFIIDRQGVIQYIQLVPEIGSEPDYDDVMNKVKIMV